MNGDSFVPLTNASWPVLALSFSGSILSSNAAAIEVFGPPVKSDGATLQTIWIEEASLSLDQCSAWLRANGVDPVIGKLRLKDGRAAEFQLWRCHFQDRGQTRILLQFFSPPSLAIPSVRAGMEVESPLVLDGSLGQKQKLDCALQLTRTVALDFNNALTSILGHTSLVLSKMEPNHPWRNSLVEVEKSAEKAAEVASDLAAFSGQEKEVRSQVVGNLNELVRRTVELFQTPGSPTLAWALQLEPRLYTVTYDEAKMQQAFAKILDNALQASMPGGKMLVRTRNQDVVESVQDGNIRLAQGCYVCVEFEDSGSGIAPDVLPRIFEPFFTTKASPNHRGLGLAWVYGIVTNHGGSVAVSSLTGQGTKVRVYLPAQRKIVRDQALATDDLNGSETILIIDDEEMLLTMGDMVLSSFGYQVLTANGGHKAIELFTARLNDIDLVITDLVMPKMSGREVIERLRKISPNVRIICSSGYSRALKSHNEELYLQKPFTSLDLLRKVKQALTDSNAS